MVSMIQTRKVYKNNWRNEKSKVKLLLINEKHDFYYQDYQDLNQYRIHRQLTPSCQSSFGE